MADEVISKTTVVLTVNGTQAKQMMGELETKVKDAEAAIKKMKAANADPKDIEKARKNLKTYQRQLDEMKSATEGVGKALTNLDSATPRQLEKALRTLNRQLKDIPPGSDVWNSHIEKIRILKDRLAEISGTVERQQPLWHRLFDWSTDAWPALDLSGRWGGKVFEAMDAAVDAYADMDQEMANVRKFTGMTADQVSELNEEFKKMDTRTPREELNKLAQEAGRLGKTSKDDVLGFVRAADQINVALDDLGEGATLTLSKLTGIFGDDSIYGTEQSLLKVGSVINDLSQNCSASAPYLADFTSRMGGVGAQAKMTIPQIMAFGAVLDSNGQQVEAASTALSQVIVRMMQEPAKYAKVAGLDVRNFTEMLKTDVNGALILFLETLNKAGGMDTLSPMFKDMGEKGARAIAALSTLAKHIGEVKAQQDAANLSFEEGTSVTNEAAIQNGTVEASLDKCRNSAHELRVELGERLYPLMIHMQESGNAVMRASLETVKFLSEHKTAVATLTVATLSYVAAVKLHALWLDRVVIKTVLVSKATKALSGLWATMKLGLAALVNGFAYLNNGLEVTYSMQERWRKSLAAMKFSTWSGLIVALASAVYLVARRYREAAEAARPLEKIREEAISKMGKERVAVDMLIAAAKDETLSLEERNKAIIKLNALIPGYNAQLDETTGKYRANKEALDEYIKSLTRKYELEGAKSKLQELGSQKAAATVEVSEAQKNYDSAAKNSASGGGRYYTTSFGSVGNTASESVSYFKSALDSANAKLAALEKQEAAILKAYGADLYKNAANDDSSPGTLPDPSGGSSGGSSDSGGSSGSGKDRFAAEKKWRQEQEADARISYATGESDYQAYTSRMAEISGQYYERLLAREDVAGTERLGILAEYCEAANKEAKRQSEVSISEEDRAYSEQLRRLKDSHARRLEEDTLSAKEREAADRVYIEAVELAELEHLSRLVGLTEEGSDERSKAEQKYLDARLKAAQRHQQEYEAQQADHERRLASVKDKYFGPNAEEQDAAYETDLAALNEVRDAELLAAEGNADERLRIEEAYQAAALLLRKQYNKESEEDARSSYERAVTGFAEWLEGEGGQALTGTLGQLVSGMSSVFSGLSTLVRAELDVQTAAIERRYDKEISYAQGNSLRVAKLEKKKEAEIAKAKNAANKKMFAMQVIQAVAQTATNALNAFGSAAAVPVVGHVLAPMAAAMAVAAGMIQVAAIKKQQQAAESQGYSKGGFTKPGAVDEPAGIVHAGEWVASQKLLASPVARPMIEALDYAQRTNTIGSLREEDVSRSIRANDSLVRMAEDDGNAALMVAAIAQSSQAVRALLDRLDQPLAAVVPLTGDRSIQQSQSEYDRLMSNKSPKSARRR